MKLGLFQFAPVWEDRSASRKLIASALASVAGSAFDWIIFPEMTLSGFTEKETKSTLDATDIEFFSQLAIDHRAAVTHGGVRDGKNVSVTIDGDGTELACYEKIHLFSYAKEDVHYRPGNTLADFQIGGMRMRPLVCYDLRFGYLFWEKAAEVDVYVVIANWPGVRAHHWKSLLTARAIENQAYVIGVNRVGSDPHGKYKGDSCVIDPLGVSQLDCGDGGGLFVTEIDAAHVQEVRTKYPFLRDRKIL